MSDITLSKAVRTNLLSLQNTAEMMATTQNRLATGKKVNSALDNPTNFFTASALNSRASDMSALLDGMANGIQTLEAADNGLEAITKTLESMQSTLRQARQDKSFETASYSLDRLDPSAGGSITLTGGAFDSAKTLDVTKTGTGQQVAGDTSYATSTANASALDGAVDVDTTNTATAGTLTISYGNKSVDVDIAAGLDAQGVQDAINTAIGNSALNGLVSAGAGAGTGDVALTAASAEDATIAVTDDQGGSVVTEIFGAATATRGQDASWDFTINNTSISLDATTGADLATAIDTINTQLEAAGEKFQAYDNNGATAGGGIGIRATTSDAGSLTITGYDAGTVFTSGNATSVASTTSASLTLAKSVDDLVSEINNDADLEGKIAASNDDGKLRIENLSTQQLDISGVDSSGNITGDSNDSSDIGGNTARAGLADQYNELRDQLDKLADDASFNGVNLLRGDNLKITFNETGTSSLDIQTENGESIDVRSLGLKLDDTGRLNMKETDLDSDAKIDDFLTQVKAAIGEVRSQASSFGSSLSIVENRQDFTKNMINTLETGAGNLTLADSNEEAANLLALQTRQQLSSTALSMASQADQAVLRLF